MTNQKDKRYTSYGLPIVSEEIINTLKRDIEIRKKDSEAVRELCEVMKEENPVLYSFVEIACINFFNPTTNMTDFIHAMVIANSVYTVLAKQSEANRLEDLAL